MEKGGEADESQELYWRRNRNFDSVTSISWLGFSRATPLLPGTDSVRSLFPRAQQEVYLNAAAGTPALQLCGARTEEVSRLLEIGVVAGSSRLSEQSSFGDPRLFAQLIGVDRDEIGLVHCTKAGEQIVLDSYRRFETEATLSRMTFTSAVRSTIWWDFVRRVVISGSCATRTGKIDPHSMEEAMDGKTGLLAITLLSNLNGHLEDIRRLADRVHALGGLVYADIIQAAGIYPLAMREMGIDFAACSGYKWLFGPHGCGFFYVRKELQGTVLPDHLFPGHVQPNYSPFVGTPATGEPDYAYRAPLDARRYQPGHISYLGYCALYEGLKFLSEVGIEKALGHSLGLNRF